MILWNKGNNLPLFNLNFTYPQSLANQQKYRQTKAINKVVLITKIRYIMTPGITGVNCYVIRYSFGIEDCCAEKTIILYDITPEKAIVKAKSIETNFRLIDIHTI